MDFEAVRRAVQRLPGSEEGSSYGTPAFRVAGQIVDSAGNPVVDAGVSIWPREDCTGGDGRFVLEGLPGGDGTLSVEHSDYCFKKVPFEAGDERLRIVLHRPATVSGRILMPDGSPPEGADCYCDGSPDDYFEKCDSAGAFRFESLPPGIRRLRARLGEYEGELDVVLKEGERRSGITLKLERVVRSYVRVSVLDQNGEPSSVPLVSHVRLISNDGAFVTDLPPGARVPIRVDVYGTISESPVASSAAK